MENPEEATHTSPTPSQPLEHKLRRLALELEAFDDPEYAAEVGQVGDEGYEDIAAELRRSA